MPWWMQFERMLREGEDEGAGGGDETTEPAGEAGAAGDKTLVSSEPKPAEAAPEPLTRESLTIPEGVEVSDELMGEFVDLLNQDMTPQERANALISLQIKTQEQAGEALADVWNTTQEEWRTATTEALGDKLDSSLAGIRQLVDDYGSPELLEAFDLTGAGNHPAIVTFLAKIAETLVTEGEPVPGAPSSSPQDRASRMYPNMN